MTAFMYQPVAMKRLRYYRSSPQWRHCAMSIIGCCLIAAVCFISLLCCYNPYSQDGIITVLSYGGSFSQNFMDIAPPFEEVTNDRMATLHDVCIEDYDDVTHWSYGLDRQIPHLLPNHVTVPSCTMRAKRITVYGAEDDKIDLVGDFNITYTKRTIPEEYYVIEDHAAYFIHRNHYPTMNNFYHFWNNSGYTLYETLQSTGQLYSHVAHRLYFESPVLSCRDPRNVTYYYQALFRAFPVKEDDSYAYHNAPHATCYRRAVFAAGKKDYSFRQPAAEFILRKFNLESLGTETCANVAEVVFLQRQPNRRVLNIDELLNTTRSGPFSGASSSGTTSGSTSITAVVMESLSFIEQLRISRCARVMIGVQGAGLQWGMFMEPGSAIIEIAWPKKGWNYYYSTRVYKQEGNSTYNDLQLYKLETNDVFLDYKSYVDFIKWRLGDVFTAAELIALSARDIQAGYEWFDIYPGRVSDAVVHPITFKDLLAEALKNVHAYDEMVVDMKMY